MDSSHWKEEDLSTWPSKGEVRQFLSTTNKTIERWQKDPTLLRREFRMLTGHKAIPIYHPDDVRRIKSRKSEPILSNSDTTPERHPKEGAQHVKPKQARGKRHDSDNSLVVRMSPHVKIYLTLAAALEYSGLPKALILKKIKEKKISAVKMGWWRIRRESLERYDAETDTVMSLSHVAPRQVVWQNGGIQQDEGHDG